MLATPLLVLLSRQGCTVDVLIDGDYVDTAELFGGWGALRNVFNGRKFEAPKASYDVRIPAIPPFYWGRYAGRYRYYANCVRRPPDTLFYKNEQEYYLEFARAIGYDTSDAPYYFLPVPPEAAVPDRKMVVLAPGCKSGEMAAKRWPFFAELADSFDDVILVGTDDDLRRSDGTRTLFPAHVRSLMGLSLRETAALLAGAAVVVANDCGLGHVAGAVGAPTILLFGPTPHLALGRFPSNVTVLRRGLHCEPCWFSKRFSACAGRIDCLRELTAEEVGQAVRVHLWTDRASSCLTA